MGVFEDLGSDAKKAFLAGLGAVSSAADKGSEIVDKLVNKGESAVKEGKQLNTSLTHKVQTGVESIKGGVLLKYMRSMTIEQRKEFVKKVVEISDQLDKEEETGFKGENAENPFECKDLKEAKDSSIDTPQSFSGQTESDLAGK